MKLFKRVFRVLLATAMCIILALTATACKPKPPANTDNNDNPGTHETDGNTGNNDGNTGNKPNENPSENPGENPSENPGENPSENPSDKPGEEPGEDPDDNPPTPPADESEGIDWSKYWDGTIGGGSSTDTFQFTGSKEIGEISGGTVIPTAPESDAKYVSVTFDGNGGSATAAQSVKVGEKAVMPAAPDYSGNMFVGWTETLNGDSLYDFNTPVTTATNLHAKWASLSGSKIESVSGNFESITVIWSETTPASSSVKYKKVGAASWATVDSQLIRAVDDSKARVDILGLPAGSYEVEVTYSSGASYQLPAPVAVNAYDRSGYAHFNYTEGIGAYKDDGSLKDNAIVIYVTEANKDTVMKDVPEAQSYIFDIPGTVWNKKAEGIGWWLNNAQYTKKDSKGNPGNTFSANGSKLGFVNIMDSHPVVIRFIGTVTTPEGCTAYNSLNEGGSVGDNGHMARMRNLKNLTIEGVGDDAMIKGWGFHFMAGSDAVNGQGKSFEVRNLTFSEYPEDAVGMEGVQSTESVDAEITGEVARCWVHNNTFLPGRCDNPAESDKKEGDGSCDFKRGKYFTLSYNYFEWCHKTNLIGSSKTSLQYYITMHHNMWNNCGARVPLVRNSNVHFYNNYVFGDAAATQSKYSWVSSKSAMSYVHSVRANAYLFSESNYYDGCKAIFDTSEGGGAIKMYNNSYTGVFNSTDAPADVSERTATVTNACKYAFEKIDFSTFDTDPNLFYYDQSTQTSQCLLDSSVGARLRVIYDVGALGFTPEVAINPVKNTPKNPVVVTGDRLTIDLSKVKDSNTVDNVLFTGSLSSGAIKGKGQLISFTLGASTELQVSTTTTGDPAPDIYDSYGRVWATKFTGSQIFILPAGTYVISAGQKDKEGDITALSFADTEASAAERVNNAKTKLAAIPSTITISSKSAINEAQTAYKALRSEERTQIPAENVERLSKALKALEQLDVDYVIARINYIGTVDINSHGKISAAQAAYNALSAAQQKEITNYSTLTAAWTAYSGIVAQAVIDKINDLPDLSAANVNKTESLNKLKDWFNAVNGAFTDLSVEEGNDQQAIVKKDANGATYKKLTDGLAELAQIEKLFDFKATLEGASVDNAATEGSQLVSLYNSLTEAQKGKLSADETAKFNSIKEAYAEYSKQAVKAVYKAGEGFVNANGSKTFTVTGGNSKTYKETDSKVMKLNGTTYTNALEMQKGCTISFFLEAGVTKTLKIYCSNAKNVQIGETKSETGKAVTGEGCSNCYVIEIQVTGTGNEIVIERGGNSPVIFIIELV